MDPSDRALRRIKLSDLRAFQAVAQHGSMAKAAAHLGLSQPAVSKAIAALERTLSVRLLDRNPHGVDLTSYGHALLKGGLAAFDDLKQSVSQIAFLADPSAGDVRIGCTEAGAVALVPAVIDALSRRYPKVTFHVTTADTASLAAHALPQRSIDLAIGATPEFVSDAQIELEPLFMDRQVVMAGPQSKWVRRRNIALQDLLEEPWILPPVDSIAGRYNAEAFRSSGLESPRAQVVSFSYPLSHALLATGRFLTLQPVLMARLAKHLPLKVLDVRFAGVRRSIGIMTLRNRTLSPLAQLFIACARDIAGALSRRQ
jgi:DNA-binding transcriptional LysR family regulator